MNYHTYLVIDMPFQLTAPIRIRRITKDIPLWNFYWRMFYERISYIWVTLKRSLFSIRNDVLLQHANKTLKTS